MGKWLSDIANEVESVVVYFKCGINLLMISNKYIYIYWKIVIFLLMNRFACDR